MTFHDLPSRCLPRQVRKDHTMMPSVAAAHMKATFGVGGDDPDDDDIIAGPAKLALTCTLTLTRLNVPARGATCRHLECFDLEAYIDLARTTSHPRWTCPLCGAPARPHQLRVDSWMAHVLEVSPADRTEVEVQPDGEFGAVPERPPQSHSGGGAAGRKRKAAAMAAAALEIDGEIDDGGETAAAAATGAAGADGGGGSSSDAGGSSSAAGAGGSSSAAGAGGSSYTAQDGGGTNSDATGGSNPSAMPPPPPPPAVPAVEVVEIDEGDDAEHPIELSDDDE